MICTTFYLSWDIRPCPLTVTAAQLLWPILQIEWKLRTPWSYVKTRKYIQREIDFLTSNCPGSKWSQAIVSCSRNAGILCHAKVLLEGQHYFWQVLSAGSKAEIHLSFSCGDLISCGSSHKISSLLLAQIRLCYNSEELMKNIVVDHWKTLSRCQEKITGIACRKLAYIINC